MTKFGQLFTKRARHIALAGALLVWAVLDWPYRFVVVTGSSMEPTFCGPQLALMDRAQPESGVPRRGDVIVFRHGSEVYVKRVHAVPGDTVRLAEFSNGARCLAGSEPFTMERLRRMVHSHPGKLRIVMATVPAGAVYVLGDNQPRSIDSRAFGAVPVGDIVGRIVTPKEAIASLPMRLIGHAERIDVA